ncbi:MAG: lamin tail domain-containing protein [bacterium]|nr:lamin tail domain-containing protein [bacterium]
MLSTTMTLLAAMAPQGPGTSTAPIVINEFSYDDSSSNDSVFVELYNRSTGPVDISGWRLQGHDGSSTTVLNAAVTIPGGTILNPGQYFVVGQAAKVPNVDLDAPSMNTVLETGADGLTLELPSGTVIDGVTWEMARWSNAVPAWLEGNGLNGDIFNPDSLPQSAARKVDGFDTDDNGCDFRLLPWSPGAANESVFTASALYENNFDDAPGTTVDNAFHHSFVSGTTADPAALGIPASPQGGNCSTWFDPSGGGNANMLRSGSLEDWVVECYAYLRGPTAAMDANDIETFAIGVRGTTDSFGEPVDVNGLFGYAGVTWQPGATGVAWFGVVTQTTSDLYLCDFGNGGSVTVLAGPIAVATDGWQRIRLSALGSDVVGNIGGTYGCDDGNRVTASGVTNCSSGVYIQYRENVSQTGAHRPLTLDGLAIVPNRGASTVPVGAGSATTTGTPGISANGLPTVGNLAYSIIGSNLVPNSVSFTVLNLGDAALPGTQIPGAPIGARFYVNNNGAQVVLRLNGPGGASSTPLAIPCITALTGLRIGAQIFDFDPALAASVPLGTSTGLTSIVGN